MSRDGALSAFALRGDSGDSRDSDVRRLWCRGVRVAIVRCWGVSAFARAGDGGDSGDSDVDPGRHAGASVQIAARHRFSASAR